MSETRNAAEAQRERILEKVRDEFLLQEVTIRGQRGETVFFLQKMPATRGWDVLEGIRAAAGGALNLEHSGGIEAALQALITALPTEFTRKLRNTMFGFVSFRNQT